ncbi:MAG: bifunctional N-acetylglucosamine-1-phosphate uridyltransferase/glucosamine-1-phosphate acetyltransferase [Candidatus Omnitrophica bacterium]|nr:bifunctional N-acetylglucosamine-1-phosphate uridyltransferase/glucosamine-1-phosphate acetyltransferase [Candidatus Omnitrophota bacterium]
MANKQFSAIVLAAGRGVRMKSSSPKVLNSIGDKPLIGHVLTQLVGLKNIAQIIVVVGYKSEEVKKYVKGNFKGVEFAYQKSALGTAHAVICAKSKIKHQNVLVLCGDTPLITKETLSSFMSTYSKEKVPAALITARVGSENQLGVILRDTEDRVESICEKVDLKNKTHSDEVNSGIYAFNKKALLATLGKIKKNKKKGEYFLTDLINIYYQQGETIIDFSLKNSEEILGINNRIELTTAEGILRKRIINKHIDAGVRVLDPSNTYIASGVSIGKNSVIYPFTFIEKGVTIGSNCLLGPFLRLRKGTDIKDNTQLGNFVEVNRSHVGPAVTMKHFGYLGDTTVEEGVNIGAGAVVANYDGKKKHKTVIKRKSFIGCDTVLVAPVKVGEGAVTGAGSVVTKNVKPKETVAGVPAKCLKKRKTKK